MNLRQILADQLVRNMVQYGHDKNIIDRVVRNGKLPLIEHDELMIWI